MAEKAELPDQAELLKGEPANQASAQPAQERVMIKKYANRRLYNTETSTYVTLDDLYEMVKDGADFEVRDAKSNEDLTRSVLTQIIFERESKGGAQNLLPLTFLKQLIMFYDDNMQHFVPPYLESTMQMFLGHQQQMRDYFAAQGFSKTLPPVMGDFNPFQQMEKLAKHNMDMFQQTMQLFTGGFGKGEK